MSGSRPNIVLTIADDQRHDMIHALGDSAVQTPNLDRLVSQGVTCTRTYHGGSTVPAVCAPCRAMLHSGRHLYHVPHELFNHVPKYMKGVPSPPSAVLLGEHLRKQGYHAYHVGKWHNTHSTLARSFDDGAAVFMGGMSDHYNIALFPFDKTGAYPKASQYIGDGFSTEIFADAAVRFLESRHGDQPFFLYVAFTSPHDPRTPPQRWAEPYPPDKVKLPENFLPEHPFDNGEMKIRDELLAGFPRTPEEVRQHIADYYGMVSHLDEQLGRIDEALEKSGQAGNTIRIHTSDHGLAVGQHGLMGKQNMYEHSTRVPLVISGPGVRQGQTMDALCQTHDLYPTLCDLAGIDTPDTCEVRSFKSALAGEIDHHRDTVYSAYMDVQRMIRDDDGYKLIEYYVNGARRTQLFHLDEDPLEMNDLADDPQQADRIARLREQLTGWERSMDDPIVSRT